MTLPIELIQALNLKEACTVRPLGGNANINSLVSSGDQRFIVKALQEHSADNTQLEGLYRQYLSDSGLPVTPFKELSGNSYVLNAQRYDYVVIKYIEGETFDTNDVNTLEELGRLLATVHTLDAHGLPKRDNWFNENYISLTLDTISGSYAAKKDFEELAKRLPKLWASNIPRGIVHGDLHGGNIIVDESRNIVSIIDWEETGIEPLILDFAGVLRYVAFSKGKWDAQLAKTFIDAYESVRKLTSSEQGVLSDALKYSFTIESVWAHMKHSEGMMDDVKFSKFSDNHNKKIEAPEL